MNYLKLRLCLCALALLPLLSQSQSKPLAFREFSEMEKHLKEVEFDKEADAVILQDIASANYNDEYNLIVSRRIRVKILKEQGIEYGNITIPYYSKDNFEILTKIAAISYTADNQNIPVITELKNSDVFRQKINDRVSVVKFAVPNVKVGSIVEYQYESISKTYGGLESWFFQTELPTLLSSFDLTVLPRAEFAYTVHKSAELPMYIKPDKNNGSIRFEMTNIAGLRNEPYMDAAKDYLQHVDFQFSGYLSQITGAKVKYMNKWEDVSRELMNDAQFGKQLTRAMPNSESVIAKFKAVEPLEKRMAAVHSYVAQNFAWNGMNSKYASEGIKDVWEKKKGTSGEINLLLINLLKSSGIEAHPLLVSERSHGLVSTQYPILDQFNKTLAYVELGGKTYVIDGTDEFTPLTFIPSDILNTNAFVVHNKQGRIIELKDEKKGNTNLITVVNTIHDDGGIDGIASVGSSDYAKIYRLRDYKKDKEKFKTNYFINNHPNIKIDSLEVTGDDKDSLPLQQDFNYIFPPNASGDYKLINTNLFTGFEKNPFINDNRFSNINFGNKQHVILNQQFILPENLKPEELPKNVQLIMPDKSITLRRTTSHEGNLIFMQVDLKIDKPVFKPDEYPLVQEFYKKMFSFLNEQIVLTSK